MKIIKSVNLVHRFSVTDENDNIIEENSALDGVNIEVEEGQFIAILGHNGRASQPLRDISMHCLHRMREALPSMDGIPRTSLRSGI